MKTIQILVMVCACCGCDPDYRGPSDPGTEDTETEDTDSYSSPCGDSDCADLGPSYSECISGELDVYWPACDYLGQCGDIIIIHTDCPDGCDGNDCA
jgi:hypothetical protein